MPELIDNTDRQIVQYVKKHPGATVPEIIGLFSGTVIENTLRNRIRRLEFNGLIQIDRVYGRLILYPAGVTA